LESLEQALNILREVGDREWEGNVLGNLGLIYNDLLNQKEEALVYYKQALRIRREVGNRGGEGSMLNNIGTLYLEQTRYDVALACFLLAKEIFIEIQSSGLDGTKNYIQKLHEEVGDELFATLLSQIEPQAPQAVDQALHEVS